MPQQTDSATRKQLCKINDSLLGKKLRVAGKVLSYDVVSGLIILVDGAYGLLLDISMALDGQSRSWATEHLSTIIGIGHLEQSAMPLQVPAVPKHTKPFHISKHLVLRAILITPAADLDLKMWNSVLEEEERYEEQERER